MGYIVVVPAAGQGKRMQAGKNKLLLELKGTPLIVHTLLVFQRDEACDAIIVATHSHEVSVMQSLFSKYQLTKVKKVVVGGAERQDSVYAGLKVCEGDGIVMIHDGARPFVKHSLIRKLTKQAEECGAAIPAVPIKDTVKMGKNGIVTQTLERSSLWAVQTPQAFRLSLITRAHEQTEINRISVTDDASLVEHLGVPVHLVESDYDNIKLTTPDDLVTADVILDKLREEQQS